MDYGMEHTEYGKGSALAHLHLLPQNHRTAGGGRDFWRPSGPTHLPKQDHLERMPTSTLLKLGRHHENASIAHPQQVRFRGSHPHLPAALCPIATINVEHANGWSAQLSKDAPDFRVHRTSISLAKEAQGSGAAPPAPSPGRPRTSVAEAAAQRRGKRPGCPARPVPFLLQLPADLPVLRRLLSGLLRPLLIVHAGAGRRHHHLPEESRHGRSPRLRTDAPVRRHHRVPLRPGTRRPPPTSEAAAPAEVAECPPSLLQALHGVCRPRGPVPPAQAPGRPRQQRPAAGGSALRGEISEEERGEGGEPAAGRRRRWSVRRGLGFSAFGTTGQPREEAPGGQRSARRAHTD